jgi:putative FmdB family regulatory protein
MPIYDMICKSCGEKETLYIFSVANSDNFTESCPKCGENMIRFYGDSSVAGFVKGGTGGGAGMGLKERGNG